MSVYRIRFNKSRGMPGRGTPEHAWRLFDGNKEYLVKNFKISVPTYSAVDETGTDWNLCCEGELYFDRVTSTAIIGAKK